MAKVTSKLQVTIPKALAERYGIRPGSEIQWVPSGDSIRVVPGAALASGRDVNARLRVFDEATRRQARRQAGTRRVSRPKSRGWTREDLYRRGRAG